MTIPAWPVPPDAPNRRTMTQAEYITAADAFVDYLATTLPTGADAFATAIESEGGSAALGDLTNVTITSVADNEVLAYDSGSSKWINQTASEAGLLATSAIGTTVQAYDADLTTWAGVTPGTGVTTALAVNVGSSGAFVTNGGALGTPSGGTLTNCTGLPVAGITASTSTALGVGSIELGHATDTTLTRVSAGVVAIEGANIIVSGGALGTPASGTLTNCGGLPVSGITASTATALGVGSIELGHASDTTISRVSAGVAAIEGANILVSGGALGTPSGGTLTNATGLPLSTGVTGQLPLANGGTGANLADPNADRLLFWDDSAGAVTWLTAGTGLTITDTTISASGGAPEGTAVLSTGETGGTKFLREDGDGTCSWQAISGGGNALTSNPLSQFAATTSSQLAGVISDETGSGALVFATSPTLVTPALGTPSSGTLTNCTGLPATGLVADTTTAVGFGSINLGHASDTTLTRVSAGIIAVEGATVYTQGGALGTPASGTLTSCTGLPISTGVSGLGSNVATFLATPSSANLRSALTDEIGTGYAVFAPTMSGNALKVLRVNSGGTDVEWATVSGGASVTVAATAPGSPSAGDLWFDSTYGRLMIYYQDANTSQWVDAADRGPGGIADSSVTNAMLASVSTQTIKGRTTSGSGAPEDLTPAQARLVLGRKTLILAAAETSSSTTPAAIADANGDWTVPVTSGTNYRVGVLANYSSAAATTGITMNVTAVSSAAGTISGYARGSITNTAANSALDYALSALPVNFTTTGITASGTGFVQMEFIFVCSATGSLEFRLATEVDTSQVTLAAGAALWWEVL